MNDDYLLKNPSEWTFDDYDRWRDAKARAAEKRKQAEEEGLLNGLLALRDRLA